MAGFVPGFEYDIFVSYAHLDDKHSGWVKAFECALEARLAVALGQEIKIWRDPKLDGMDKFNETIATTIQQSALFAAVVSPSYLNSDYCKKELSCFLRAASQLPVHGKSRVARIRKMDLAGIPEPPELAAETLGVPFFDLDDPALEFEPNSGTIEQFKAQVKLVANACVSVLRKMRSSAEQRQPRAQTIFLAGATPALAQARATVKSELEAFGHRVVLGGALLDGASIDEQALTNALKEASYAVHLFGDTYGLIPDGSDLSLPCIEYQRAAAAGLPQIAWLKPDTRPDPRQKEFLALLRSASSETKRRVDLCEIGLSDFCDALGDAVALPTNSGGDPRTAMGSSVYLIAPEEDLTNEGFRAIRRALLNSGFPVQLPVFEASPGELRNIEEQHILANEATIIYYETARDAWVDQKRNFVINALGKAQRKGDYWRGVYVSPPKTKIKEMLFGDFLGASIPEEIGFTPLLVMGDFGPFSQDKLSPLLDNLAGSKPRSPSSAPRRAPEPGPSNPSAPPAVAPAE